MDDDNNKKKAIVDKVIGSVASEYVTQCVLSGSTPNMAAFCVVGQLELT